MVNPPPQPPVYAECYVCGEPMDGLSEDDCHCFHRKELAPPPQPQIVGDALVHSAADDSLNASRPLDVGGALSVGSELPAQPSAWVNIYHVKLKSRKRIDAEIPRNRQGWWADVCPGAKLVLRDATAADIARCSLNEGSSRNPADYLCEIPADGALVSKVAIEHCRTEALAAPLAATRTAAAPDLTRWPAPLHHIDDAETPEQAWEFWKPLVTNEDGSLNEQAVRDELSDFSMLLRYYSTILCEVTGNRISKETTHPSAVIGVFNDYLQERVDEAVKEELDAGQVVSASTAAPVARSEKQSSVHPAVNDRTVTTSVPLQSPCALDRSELPVRLSDDAQDAARSVAECAPYLKDDETPAECIARNRADSDALLTLLRRVTGRYQFLRRELMGEALMTKEILAARTPEEVDAAIDAAIATPVVQQAGDKP